MMYDVNSLRPKAEAGDAEAQFEMGKASASTDHDAAFEWFKKSAEQGNPYAQTYLGYYYQKGKGVKEDRAEAVKWYRKAAEQGYVIAQSNLGKAYEEGDGIAQDFVEAYFWYKVAADFDENYSKLVDKVKAQLTPEQIETVNQRVEKLNSNYIPVTHFDEIVYRMSGVWHGSGSEYIIHGDGSIEYGSNWAPRGSDKIKLTLSHSDIEKLVATINDTRYLLIPDDYNDFGASCGGVYRTDFPYLFTAVKIDGKTHRVFHYLGCDAAPKRLTQFESAVEGIAKGRKAMFGGLVDLLRIRPLFKFGGILGVLLFWPSVIMILAISSYNLYQTLKPGGTPCEHEERVPTADPVRRSSLTRKSAPHSLFISAAIAAYITCFSVVIFNFFMTHNQAAQNMAVNLLGKLWMLIPYAIIAACIVFLILLKQGRMTSLKVTKKMKIGVIIILCLALVAIIMQSKLSAYESPFPRRPLLSLGIVDIWAEILRRSITISVLPAIPYFIYWLLLGKKTLLPERAIMTKFMLLLTVALFFLQMTVTHGLQIQIFLNLVSSGTGLSLIFVITAYILYRRLKPSEPPRNGLFICAAIAGNTVGWFSDNLHAHWFLLPPTALVGYDAFHRLVWGRSLFWRLFKTHVQPLFKKHLQPLLKTHAKLIIRWGMIAIAAVLMLQAIPDPSDWNYKKILLTLLVAGVNLGAVYALYLLARNIPERFIVWTLVATVAVALISADALIFVVEPRAQYVAYYLACFVLPCAIPYGIYRLVMRGGPHFRRIASMASFCLLLSVISFFLYINFG